MQNLKQIISKNDFENAKVLKALNDAYRYLGELKGLCQTIPNQAILVNTLTLQEAQDSSAIENIITTQDEIYKHLLNPDNKNIATKEVENYSKALHYLYEKLQENKLLTINMIVDAQTIIKGNEAGIRKQQGTKLINEQTNKIVYEPPSPEKLTNLLKDLEQFINDKTVAGELDSLIKMAIIHHQFESIHPFYDGNGRIGRIINIIYLVQQDLLDTPILYLSRYINHNKAQYYKLLQSVRDNNTWQEWLLFMINGISKTAQSTIKIIIDIKTLQQEYKLHIRNNHTNIYSQELLNNIFNHPYTKIAFLKDDLGVSRLTAGRYLDKLTTTGLLVKHKFGKENYYFNPKLIKLLSATESLTNEQTGAEGV